MKLFCLLAAVLVVAVSASAQKTGQPDFESMEKGAWNAFSKGDGAYFQGLLADDAVVFNGVAPSSKAQLVKDVSSKPCEVKSFSFGECQTRMRNPKTALVTYFANQEATCAGQPQPAKVLGSTVYVKRNGKWSAYFHQESPVTGM